ncbi:MAG: HAMP domain-containing histidine kinase [Lentimicrobium sp.]|nr:HAMP domain-containing histidine kinase [Lentimicrobium sp.]
MGNIDKSKTGDSEYASSGRAAYEEIVRQYDVLAGNQLLSLITDAIPDVAMILNEERQLVFSNKALLALVGDLSSLDLLGKRPGELLDCLHASETPGGCGTTKSCKYCGAINAILECQRTGMSSMKECRITSKAEGFDVSYDLQINAAPFKFNDNNYIILTVKDISDLKRRRVLERMFFHDVLNTATGLNGLLSAIKDVSSPEERQEFVDIAEKASNDLIEDIVSQRALSAAENGDLQIKITRYSSVQVLHDVAAYLAHHQIAEGKRIVVDPFSHSIQMETDPQLLKRVLINLIKNALEASPKDSVITIGSRINNTTIWFWVNNPGQMSEMVQRQIFQRSFSTKGADRGIGTYSVKLLTTNYLKGTVNFESDADAGTTFRIEIPVGIS